MKKLIIVITVLLLCFSANSQKRRLALVIGNGNYSMSILANPVNDAIEIEALLKSSGFQVKRYTDLDQTDMKRVIDEFGSRLNSAEVGLFFYAGHGIQANGRNYLIPVDASLKTENDVEYNCVDAGRILAKMEDANTRTNIVILDACRDNPFERSWSRKSTGAGLAFMDAPNGSLISYSTAPGKTASDGYDRNSPFTSALIKYMSIPNLKIEDFFKQVRVEVRENTNGKQVPWESTSLEGDFYFNLDADYVSADAAVKDIEPGIGDKLKDHDNIDPAQQRMSDFEKNRKELAAGIRSVAIMPFANYTGDESKAYLASGLQDALISELGQLGSVRVTARTSTMQYANFQKTINEIASELNVEGVIETSLIGLGENIRIQLKLYSAFPVEQMIWSQVYDSEMNDILNLYNRVVKNIADEIQLSLTPEQESKLEESREINARAYDAYLRSYQHWGDVGKESLQKALEYLNVAVEKEPDWAPLYVGLAQVWFGIQQMGFEPPSVTSPKIYNNLNKALELDPDLSAAHFLRAMIAHLMEWDWEKSEKEFLKALAVNPNDAQSRVLYAQLLCVLQRTDEALSQGRLALDLDPFNPLIKCWYGAILPCAGDCKTALDIAEEVTAADPGHYLANNVILFAAFICKEYDKVIKAERYLLPIYNVKEEDIKKIERIFNEQGFIKAYEKIMNHLEDFASNNPISPIDMATRYMIVNQPDKAMDWLEKGFELHEPTMTYIATKIFNLDPLFNNPRFIDIVKKMNLPLPKTN